MSNRIRSPPSALACDHINALSLKTLLCRQRTWKGRWPRIRSQNRGEMSDQIVSTFKTFMLNQGGSPDRWYIGITKDINGRLHGDHRVDVNDPAWIYENAGSAATARRVE